MPKTLEKAPLLEWRKNKAASLKGLERRVFLTGDVELREDAADGLLHLTGYASVTETPYEVGFYVETIKRNAFARTLGEAPDVTLLLNHEGLPLARTKAGSLRLSEDDVGLRVEADLDPDDPDTVTLKRKMDRGDLDGQMSMAFQVTSQRWDEDYTSREILGLSLHRGDVSIVTQGASPTTSASIRSEAAALALADLGNEVIVAALVEWRDFTLLAPERREGKTLSTATREVLSNVAGMIDDAGDLLDDLLAVPNPDTDDGEADTVERSITSEKALCAAIRGTLLDAGTWGTGGEQRRRYLVERARELTLGGLVPDDWNEDGTLRALDGQEQRETWGDIYTALEGALDDALVTGGDYYYVWVRDFTDAEVIYSAGGDLYSAPYTLVPGGECTVDVGAATKVRPVTEYVGRSNEPEAVETRAPTPLPDSTIRARQVLRMREIRGAR